MRDPAACAANALDHLELLRNHLSRGSLDDKLVFDAVSLRLASAIEAVSPGDELTLLDAFGDRWFEIKATRNAVAHNYTWIDARRLADTVRDDLDGFEAGLRGLLNA